MTPQVSGRTDVGRTGMPSTFLIGSYNLGADITAGDETPINYGNVKYLDISDKNIASNTEFTVSKANTNIFINNEPGGTYTYNNCKYVRIVVQESSKAPYILVLKMKA